MEPSPPVKQAAAPLAVGFALLPHTGVVVLTPARIPSLLKADAGSPANIQRGGMREGGKEKKKPDPSAKTQAEMFLCLGKCQRKKFPLRVGLCLQDFKPLIWTITASVCGNRGREVPAEPAVLEVRTVIRALALIRVQSSATLGSAHARAVSVHHAPGAQGSGGAEAPGDVNNHGQGSPSIAAAPRHRHPVLSKSGMCSASMANTSSLAAQHQT